MANDDQNLELDLEKKDDAGASEGSNSKLIIIVLIVVGVLLIGGGVAALLLTSDEETPAAEVVEGEAAEGEVAEGEATEGEDEKVVEEKLAAQYIGVPEAITSNLVGKRKNRTVQIKMSFMVRGDDAAEIVKRHMPQLKNDVLMLVSQGTVEELKKPDGRIALQQKSLETVQATLTNLEGKPTVERVLFVSFVMQ